MCRILVVRMRLALDTVRVQNNKSLFLRTLILPPFYKHNRNDDSVESHDPIAEPAMRVDISALRSYISTVNGLKSTHNFSLTFQFRNRCRWEVWSIVRCFIFWRKELLQTISTGINIKLHRIHQFCSKRKRKNAQRSWKTGWDGN